MVKYFREEPKMIAFHFDKLSDQRLSSLLRKYLVRQAQ